MNDKTPRIVNPSTDGAEVPQFCAYCGAPMLISHSKDNYLYDEQTGKRRKTSVEKVVQCQEYLTTMGKIFRSPITSPHKYFVLGYDIVGDRQVLEERYRWR